MVDCSETNGDTAIFAVGIGVDAFVDSDLDIESDSDTDSNVRRLRSGLNTETSYRIASKPALSISHDRPFFMKLKVAF